MLTCVLLSKTYVFRSYSRYLQEIGYTDTIIDVRSNRVRSLLGLNPAGTTGTDKEELAAVNGALAGGGGSVTGGTSPGVGGSAGGDPSGNSKRLSESQGRRAPAKKVPPASLAEAMIMDTEAAVMANFDFLAQEGVEGVEVDDEDDLSDDMDDTADDEASEEAASKRGKIKAKVSRSTSFHSYFFATHWSKRKPPAFILLLERSLRCRICLVFTTPTCTPPSLNRTLLGRETAD